MKLNWLRYQFPTLDNGAKDSVMSIKFYTISINLLILQDYYEKRRGRVKLLGY